MSSFIFEAIIFFILIICGYWMRVIGRSFFYCKDETGQPKTKIVRLAILFGLAVVFSLVFWGSFIEPRLIKTNHLDISLATTRQKESIKIALVSDLHVGLYKKFGFVQRVVKKIDENAPDLVLFAGDFILGEERNTNYLSPLAPLGKRYPSFAVTGNHEFDLAFAIDPDYNYKTATLRRLFNKWGIIILDNQTRKISIKNNTFNIGGAPDLWTGKADLTVINKFIDPRYPKILLCHNPDIILENGAENFDLILSGHTHNGQIRLPLLENIPSLPTKLGRLFSAGLFKLKNGYLYITAGLSETGPRARLFNRPELTIINLDL
jgi:predicted MPP superfamily phosphohydrolase